MQVHKPELAAVLRRVPLFTDLSETELALVAERVARRTYSAGMNVFSEGDPCRELMIVEEGSIRLLKTAANGRQQLVGIERAGNSLAEVPVFDGGRYSATAEAITNATVLQLDAAHFRKICSHNPDVALKVIKVLAYRLRYLDALVEELSFATVRDRLIAHLVRLAETEGHGTASGVEIELTENNEILAARLGTVRELISRNLGRLHGEGLVMIRRRTVSIPDMAKLKQQIF